MNDHEQLLRRLDELGDTAVANAIEQPFDVHHRRPHARRHRRGWWTATALVAVAVLGSALWVSSGDDADRVTTVAADPEHDDFPMLLPEAWTATDAKATTRDPAEPTPQFDIVASHLLTRDGAAAAAAQVIDHPVAGFGPEVGNTATPATIDGRDAFWFNDTSGTGLVIALEPGRSLGLMFSSAAREELTALALAYDRDLLDFDTDAMPEGWSTAPDPAHLVELYDGRPPQTWASAHNDDASGDPIFLAATHVPDPSAVLEQLAGLAGRRAADADVHGKPGLVILGVGPHPSASMVVWAHDDRTISALSGAPGADPDDLLALAESVHRVDRAVWHRLEKGPSRPGR